MQTRGLSTKQTDPLKTNTDETQAQEKLKKERKKNGLANKYVRTSYNGGDFVLEEPLFDGENLLHDIVGDWKPSDLVVVVVVSQEETVVLKLV